MDGVEVHHAPRASAYVNPTQDYISRTTEILSPSRPLQANKFSALPLHGDNLHKNHATPIESIDRPESTDDPSVIVLSGLEDRAAYPKPRASEYHSRLRYRLTDTANGQWEPIPADASLPLASLSIPNTFKNRLYPNAQTTNEIGIWHDINEEHKPDNLQNNADKLEEDQPRDADHTPSWMPSLLHEQWPASNVESMSSNTQSAGPDSSVKRVSKAAQSSGNFDDVLESSAAYTMIHNSDYAELEEPAWKHVNGEYEAHRDAKFDFRNIFLSLNSNERNAIKSQAKSQRTNATDAESQISGTEEQKSNLPHYDDTSFTPTNAQSHMTPGVFRNLESPLKLFNGDRYNTYTKNTLSDLLKNFGRAQEKQPVAEAILKAAETNENTVNTPPEANVSTHKSIDVAAKQREQHFVSKAEYLKNAEDLYAKLLQNPLNGASMSKPPSFCRSTSTSTPLKNKSSKAKLQVEKKGYEDPPDDSLSTGFDAFTVTSLGFDDRDQERMTALSMDRSHTFETISENHGVEHHRQVPHIIEPHTANGTSLYTFDETDDDRLPPVADRHDSPQSENTYSTISEAATVVTPQRVKSSPRKALWEISRNISPQIKWKSVSQLKNAQQPPPLSSAATTTKPQRGQVYPNQYKPASFDGMVFDEENRRWVLRTHEDTERGSLDSIEDLQSDTFLRHHKGANNNQREDNQAQVSFQIPHLAIKPVLNDYQADANERTPLGTSEDIPEPANVGNVTQVAELGDVTFLESQRQLVAIVTDALKNKDDLVNWDLVADIDLQGRDIESIGHINKVLPRLRTINLAHNAVEYIEGLPAQVCDVNLSSNKISSMTLFSSHCSVTRLNLSCNELTSLTNLSHNVALACLDVSHNVLGSIRGIEGLHNLTTLNLSSNRIAGPVSFYHCHLPHLAKLDLSHNQITGLTGLENLPSLRILDVAHNSLTDLDITTAPLPKMKKLLVQGNQLKKLDVFKFPQLRVLRTDAALPIEIDGLKSLRHLEELSCRGEASSADSVLLDLDRIRILDLSGLTITPLPRNKQLSCVTDLNLSACDLESVPSDLSSVFPNVRKLNLNFNRLQNIGRLSELTRLENLSVVSNRIDNFSTLLLGLSGLRRSLRVLDLRLNPLTFDIHAWVFDPLESYAIQNMLAGGHGPIQLEKFDDIDLFLVNYKTLAKDVAKWELRDREFCGALEHKDIDGLHRRQRFEATIITTCRALRMLNGNTVTEAVLAAAKAAWHEMSDSL